MEKYKQSILLIAFGAVGYSIIEILWRGYTHWTMAIAGGIGFLMLCLLETRMRCRPLVQQVLLGSALITALELAVGIVVNLLFGLAVWDYSGEPWNFLGQICISYSMLWFLLCLILLPLIRGFRTFAQMHNKKGGGDLATEPRMPEI